MKIIPTFDNVLITRDPLPEKSGGGIILPNKQDEKAKTGTVIAVGIGRWKQGAWNKQTLAVGDRILFRAYGVVHMVDGKEVFMLNQDEILGVIRE